MKSEEGVSSEVKRARYAIFALCLITIACSFTPAARVLVVIVPAYAFFLGLYLQRRVPRYFVAFVFWLSFLVPCVRRLIEYHAGAETGTPILISPFFALLAGMSTFRNRWSLIVDSRLRRWVYIFMAFLYAMFVGFELNSRFGMLQDATGWLGPMFFALYLFANREDIGELVKALQSAFVYGTALMSVYGLYQYFVLAPWDATWMVNTPSLTSIGSPAPMEVRVFSTMNTPQPLSACLVVGILMCVSSKSRIRYFVVPLAILVLGLTESRSGYLGAAVGLLYLAYTFNTRQRVQLGFVTLGVVAAIGLATQIPEIDSLLTQRVQSFTQISDDGSYNDRVASQERAVDLFETSPFGLGMGASGPSSGGEGPSWGIAQPEAPVLVDNGLEMISLTFGWFGALVYIAGFAGAVLFCFRNTSDPALFPFKATLVALLFESPIMGVFGGIDGILIWMSVGVCTAWYWNDYESRAKELAEGSVEAKTSSGARTGGPVTA